MYHRTGDILTCRDDYVAHQTNCTTTTAGGLARHIFAKWPHADTYHGGTKRIPGRFSMHGGPTRGRRVINIGTYTVNMPRARPQRAGSTLKRQDLHTSAAH